MESGKGHQEEEEEEYEDFGTKKDATVSNNNIKDGKNSDKANAVRSKHSVTEQRRRSKINERFQMLRKLIPHSDQKRDTASFLLEVIQHVKFLQEKEQKYEGSLQPCSSEPTKLIPWRNSHWHVQSIASQPQNVKNGSGPGSTFPDRFDANSAAVPTAMQSGQENPIESDAIRDASCRSADPVTEVRNQPMSIPMPLQTRLPVSITNDGAFSDSLPRPSSDAQSTESPTAADGLNRHDELTIEGGTIGISSVYSHELLSSLTQVLHSTGVDLSQASISVQINLGKRANIRPTPWTSTAKDHDMPMPSGNQPARPFQESSNIENLDQSQKRQKILKNV